MPPFTTRVFDKFLKGMPVVKMKINRLELNEEVNAGYGNDTTLLVLTLSVSQNTNKVLLLKTIQ